MAHVHYKYLQEYRRQLICFMFVFFLTLPWLQDIDKTSQTTFVDVVETVLFPYHEQPAAVT